jgi:peptide/nickel transport system substrate-binding protein
MRQVVMTRNPALGQGPFNRQRYSNPAMDVPLAAALTTMDPERRWALLEDKGVLPVIFLKNTWAGRRDRVVDDPSLVNHTSAQYARPAN